MTSQEKLSKKEKKALNSKRRNVWAANPVTHIIPDKKKEQSRRQCRK